MTDRVIAFTVLLKKEIREDDAEHIRHAIAMIRGVGKVTPVVGDIERLFVEEKVRQEIGAQLWAVLFPKMPPITEFGG
jgi:hypothetical protein